MSAELIWDVECVAAESPVWDVRGGRVLFASMRDGRIFAYGVADGSHEMWQLPEVIGSFGLCESGRLIVALKNTIVLFDPSSGDIEQLVSAADELEGTQFNDGRPGPDGCYWVGTRLRRPDDVSGGLRGSIYRVTPNGELHQKATGYIVTNGIAFSPDGGVMYNSDSGQGFIDTWTFDAAAGEISGQRRLATPTPEMGRPDGAAVDVDGNYWSANVTGGAINQFSPAGDLISRFETPCAAPSMPCFAPGSMYFTSLTGVHRKSVLDFSHLTQNVGGLFRTSASTRGADVALFADQTS